MQRKKIKMRLKSTDESERKIKSRLINEIEIVKILKNLKCFLVCRSQN